MMKIPFCFPTKPTWPKSITCPSCRSSRSRKHGSYTRYSFHGQQAPAVALPVRIPRYRCLNPECRRCTFSILPEQLLRYCRFCLPSLQIIHLSHSAGVSLYQLIKLWRIGRGVLNLESFSCDSRNTRRKMGRKDVPRRELSCDGQ
jgi:hypothetical protein